MPETAAAPPRRSRARKPADEQPDAAGEELTRVVNGLRVIADDPVHSHLPIKAGAAPITFRGVRLLTLEDQSQVYACTSCEFTGGRGEVQVHRAHEHGAGAPGRRRQEPGIPSEVLAMTLGELMHLAAGIHGWESLFEQQAAQSAEWQERALAAEAEVKAFNKLLGKAGYAKVEE